MGLVATLQALRRVTILCGMPENRDIWGVPVPERVPGADGVCAAPGCAAGGEYRAPRSRHDLKNFFWFCLRHVREYNAAWNYYAGMSESEIEAHRRADVTWRRPSWPFGCVGKGQARGPEIRDDFGVYGDAMGRPGGPGNSTSKPGWAPETEEQKALAMLELSPSATASEAKARYKQLVKRFHPDANGGDKKAEDQLKLINDAYTTLKRSDWLMTGPR